jgi:hypothetical protein
MSVLVDTDMLIWHLRGYSQAAQRIDELAALTLSAMSYLELTPSSPRLLSIIK